MPGGPSLFGDNQAPRPPAPPSVLTAVKLMYVGAGLSVLVLLFSIITVNSTRSKLRHALPHDTTTQINTAVHAYVAGAVIGGLIGVALWIWMANKNKAGRNWARILGTVFFGISTLETLYSLVEHISVLDKLVAIVIWLVGLAIVVLLWRRESSDYFKPRPQSTW